MANCKKCGRKIPDGEKYCISCREIRDNKRKFWGWIGGLALAVIGGIVYVATKGRVKINKKS